MGLRTPRQCITVATTSLGIALLLTVGGLATGLAEASEPPPAAPGGPEGVAAGPGGHRDLVQQALLRPVRPPLAIGPAGAELPKVMMDTPGPIVNREVLGYLPYWEMGYEPARWELLTILAWFGVNMDSSGDITGWHGWGGEQTEELVGLAKAHGVRVIVTVTLFDNDAIGSLVGSSGARANAIQSCLSVMAVHGADGVNIDFEFVPASAKANFVTFMTELTAAVRAAQPNGWDGHVSLAGPAVDWGGAYDFDQLLLHTDGIMVMAYGYHWSGGNPGPVSPLYGGGKWGTHAIDWTVDDYLTFGGIENRGRVFIGLPWYGREWAVASTDVPGTALANGSSIFMDDAIAEAETLGAQLDQDSRTAYYHRPEGQGFAQVWYDDAATFAEKVAYVAERDLGGIGIWALGYDGGRADIWNAIEAAFVDDVVVPPDVGPEPGPEPAAEPGPEPIPEFGVEAGPELDGLVESEPAAERSGQPEPEPDALDSGPAGPELTGADAGAGPTVKVQPLQSSGWESTHVDAGCQGGGPGSPGVAWLLLVGLLVGVKRRASSRA